MILVLCSHCKHIIGCGVDENGMVKKHCCYCYDTNCSANIRVPVVRKGVILVNFEDGCLGHDPPPIGFKIKGK